MREERDGTDNHFTGLASDKIVLTEVIFVRVILPFFFFFLVLFSFLLLLSPFTDIIHRGRIGKKILL